MKNLVTGKERKTCYKTRLLYVCQELELIKKTETLDCSSLHSFYKRRKVEKFIP